MTDETCERLGPDPSRAEALRTRTPPGVVLERAVDRARALWAAGPVRSRREGRMVMYSPSAGGVALLDAVPGRRPAGP